MKALRVEGLAYCYPDGTPALRGLDLEVEPGERLALVGPNGAGKSTLFLCALGLLRGWSGRVEVFGIEPRPGPRLAELRRRAGLVLQEPDDMLFMPTLLDDARFGPANAGLSPDEVDARAREALERVGLWEQRDRPAHHLSGGEKRRAALAAVLSSRPELLLLDEPTASLDPRSRRALLRLLSELDAALVVATHDLALAAELAERVAVVHGGRVVAQGPALEVLLDRELMEAHELEVPCLPPEFLEGNRVH